MIIRISTNVFEDMLQYVLEIFIALISPLIPANCNISGLHSYEKAFSKEEVDKWNSLKEECRNILTIQGTFTEAIIYLCH